ncbi:MAG: hypothetical protein AAF125_17355, partial [Chloroflexota bacterium]
ESNPFNHPDLHQHDGKLHPLVSFMVLWLCIAATLLVFVYAVGTPYFTFGLVVCAVLMLAAVMVYRTA